MGLFLIDLELYLFGEYIMYYILTKGVAKTAKFRAFYLTFCSFGGDLGLRGTPMDFCRRVSTVFSRTSMRFALEKGE